ncbi:MAG: hypothetical protein ACLRZG_08745 [Streptococcus sp.]
MTNLYRSFGLVGGIGAAPSLGSNPAGFLKSKGCKKVSLLSLFPSLFNNGASFMVGILVLLNPAYVIPFIVNHLGEYGNSSCGFVLQADASSCLSGIDGTTSLHLCFYWNGEEV